MGSILPTWNSLGQLRAGKGCQETIHDTKTDQGEIMSKQAAIGLVNQFASQSSQGVWPQIDRNALAAGLIARINDPNLINQMGTPLCGPASLVRAIDDNTPIIYAQAAIDLYTRGTARIGNLDVRPGSELKQSAPQGNTNPADWIMLASIRDSNNWFLSPAGLFGSNLAGMTLPQTMESWFSNAGYTQIINITYFAAKPIYSVLAMEMHRSSYLFSQGYKVVLFIDSDVLDPDCQGDLVSMYPDHWVALTSTITDGGIINYDAPISFKIYSWGRQMSVPVDPRRPLSKRDFIGKYYGFIAAHQ